MLEEWETRKNCLQWGLRILPPKAYYTLLRRYVVDFYPGAYELIENAHMNKEGGAWWWQWLCCEILREDKWINIATGGRTTGWCSNKVAKFPSWAAYEGFREELREAASQALREQLLTMD
jgi:hypothetical protein